MKKILSKPLIPSSKVCSVFISSEYPEILNTLNEKYDIETIKVIENKRLNSAIASHADCALLQVDANTIFIEKVNYQPFVNNLTNSGGDIYNNIYLNICSGEIASPYPGDVGLNAKVVGNKIFCNIGYISQSVKDYCHYNGIQLIHCNQGYASCSTVVLNDNAIITDDLSIYNSAIQNEIDCLIVSKGSVKLNGYDYGFIGGTCGMINKDVLAFTGKIKSHTDHKDIIKFLNKYNISYIELSDNPLIDIGGIIPILEEKA